MAPTITIGEIKRTHSGLLGSKVQLTTSETPGTDSLGRQWLRDGIYEISLTIQDNVGGSDMDTGFRPVIIHSKGVDGVFDTADDKVFSPSLVTYNKFNVWVGPPESPANDCVTQNPSGCRVDITVRDIAGNDVTKRIFLNIDYTAPTAQ